MARNLTEERLERIKPVKKAEDYQNTLERFNKRKAEEKAETDKKAKAEAAQKKAELEAKKAAALKAKEGKYQPFANLADLLKN
jgi:membrane protein involved in colicin uptake